MKLRETFLFTTLVVLFSVVMGACGADPTATPRPTNTPVPAEDPTPTPTPERPAWEIVWEKTLAAANEEGKVVVTSCGGAGRRTAMTGDGSFEELYPGITLEHTPFNSRDLWPKVVKEATLGQYNFDIRIGGADTTTFNAMYNNNSHAEIVRDEWFILPEVRDPEAWRGGMDFGWLDTGKKYAFTIPLSLSAGDSFWVNRDLISKEELSSVKQLSDPKWKGKIVSLSSEGGAAQNTMMLQMLGFGEPWLLEFLKNEPIILRDHRAQIEGLVRGQYAIATTLDTRMLRTLKGKGLDTSNIEALDQEIPSLSNACESLQLHSNMPHPNAAKIYVNWLLSQKQQQVFNDSIPSNSRRLDVTPGVPGLLPSDEDLKTVALSQDEGMNPQRNRFVELVQGVLIK